MLFKKKEKPLTKKEKTVKYLKDNSLTLGIGGVATGFGIVTVVNTIATMKNKKKLKKLEERVSEVEGGSEVLEQLQDISIAISKINTALEELHEMVELPADEYYDEEYDDVDEENPIVYSDPDDTENTLAGPIAEALKEKTESNEK